MISLSNSLCHLWGKISKQVKTAFIAATVIGLLAHITFLTNRFFNHDSILYTLIDPNSTFFLQQGKWLSLFMNRIVQGDITTSGIIVPIALLFLGLTASFTVSILKIKSPVWSAVTGGFLVLFPSVACANVYESSAVFFSALLLSAIAVYVTIRWKYGFIAGVALLTLSFGVYSVFSGYAAGLFLLYLIFSLISGDTSVKDALVKGLKYLAVLAISALLYYIILQLLLRIQHVSLMDYRGIDNIGKFSISSISTVLYESYRKVYYFFYYGIFLYRGYFEIEPIFRYLNWLSIGLTLFFCGCVLIKKGIIKDIGRTVLIVLLVVIFPLAIHAIAILGQNAYTHWIMCYPFVLVYVALLASVDSFEEIYVMKDGTKAYSNKVKFIFKSSTILTLVIATLLCRQWFFTTNQAYEYIRYQNQNAIAKGIMFTNDIQNDEEYNANVPIAFVGDGGPIAFQYQTNDFLVIHGEDGIGYTGFNGAIIDSDRLKKLLTNWIGIDFKYCNTELVTALTTNSVVIDMPIYPSRGSIKLIDGVLVVKLSDIQIKQNK